MIGEFVLIHEFFEGAYLWHVFHDATSHMDFGRVGTFYGICYGILRYMAVSKRLEGLTLVDEDTSCS